MPANTNAFSVDVEDWFHDESRGTGASDAARLDQRVERNLERLLEIFAQHGTRVTLFFLGDVAACSKALVRAAVKQGHEIGCHGLVHQPVARRDPVSFRDDVRRARGLVEDAAGVAVCGFRAPCFIRRHQELWALDVIASQGFAYDSSFLPLRYWPGRVATLTPDLKPVRLANGLWEFPLPLSRIHTGHVLPCAAGGFVLRALPFGVTRHYVRRFNREVGPAVMYTHPWEIDPDSGKLPGTPLHVRFFNGIGRRRMERQLDRLLREFRFAPIAEVYAAELAQGPGNPAAWGTT